MRDQIAFETGKDNLQPQIVPALNSVAKVLKRYPKTSLQISGFTDNVGGNAYNMLLSKSRAQSLADQLLRKGIASKRMKVSGFGPKYSACSNATAQGRACNRRVEISLYSS
jgi:outer membrane protein OmpA-like peptidoglycan-associated protein